MAKTKYTKEEIVAFVKDLDTRAKTLSETKIDAIINRGYAELTTVSKRLFSNEEVLSLASYYEGGEYKFIVDVDEDVTEVYDVYTTIEGEDRDKSMCQEIIQGVGIYRNDSLSFRDNRYIGRIQTDLSTVETEFDNLVIKYSITEDSSEYMNSLYRNFYMNIIRHMCKKKYWINYGK